MSLTEGCHFDRVDDAALARAVWQGKVRYFWTKRHGQERRHRRDRIRPYRPDRAYLDSAVRDFALRMSRDDLVGERDGQRFGKKVLREAFADLLPQEITWRVKTAIEYGSAKICD